MRRRGNRLGSELPSDRHRHLRNPLSACANGTRYHQDVDLGAQGKTRRVYCSWHHQIAGPAVACMMRGDASLATAHDRGLSSILPTSGDRNLGDDLVDTCARSAMAIRGAPRLSSCKPNPAHLR